MAKKDRFLNIIGVAALACVVLSLTYARLFPESSASIEEKSENSWAELQKEIERGKRLDDLAALNNNSQPDNGQEPSQTVIESTTNKVEQLPVAVRIILVCLGVLCFWISVFLYTDEQGKIQNRLEVIWIRINDAQKFSVSKHTLFVNSVANLLVHALNFLFGERLVSVMAIGAALCYATAAANTTMYFLSSVTPSNDFLKSAVFWLALGAIPAFLNDKFFKYLWIAVVAFVVWDDFVSGYIILALLAAGFGILEMAIISLALLTGIGLACLFFFTSIVIVRKTLSDIAVSTSFWKTALFPLFNCLPFLILVGTSYVFVYFLPRLSESATLVVLVLLVAAWCANVAFLFSAFLFFILSILLIIHKLIWGVIDRPVYALQQLGIAKRSKLFGTVGALLITAGFGGLEWLEKIANKLNPF